MNIAFLIGRIIFATFWLMGSFNRFKNLNYMSEYAKARGTPSPILAVAGTGVILLLGGLSMLLGVYPVVGIILLIIFLLGVSALPADQYCLANTHQERLRLRVHGGVPLVQRDLHRRLVEGWGFRSSVAHEDVERAELRFNLLEDSAYHRRD